MSKIASMAARAPRGAAWAACQPASIAPQLHEEEREVGLAREVIEEGAVGDLDGLTQLAHRDLVERSLVEADAQRGGQIEAEPGRLALTQRGHDLKITIIL
jgi:hypothetical protein